MKNLILLLLLSPFLCNGHQATIFFDIENSTAKNIGILLIDDYTNPQVLFGDFYVDIPLTEGKTKWTYEITKPVSIKIFYESTETKKSFEYYFFITPGDKLFFSANEASFENSIQVTGQGRNNNQPMIQALHDSFSHNLNTIFQKDTLPYPALNAIQEKNSILHNALNEYIKKYRPSKEFIRNESIYLELFSMSQFFYYKNRQKFHIGKAYYRNEELWQGLEDSFLLECQLNDENLLSITDFPLFISTYLMRTKERLWMNPELMAHFYENDEDVKMIENDPENFLREKIINKYFTGKTAEFLYALLFQGAGEENDDNLPEIYSRFKQKYPTSQYLLFIKPKIVKIEERRNRKLTEEILLITETESIQTFEEVLNLVKGKTVLLDMWGTWCTPCRKEFSNHSNSIKDYFKAKPLEYLYIANYDEDREALWKELIQYYNLSGTHILANRNLTKDIMVKIKSKSYPTNIIIKKDGSYELITLPKGQKEFYEKIDSILQE